MTPARFTVLASGSSGNAALLEADGFGLLIDCGLRPEFLAERLAAVQRTWDDVAAVLLTHTHGDHWNRHTFAHLRRLNKVLFAHPGHHAALSSCRDYDPLHRAGLTRTYADGQPLPFAPGLTARPVRVPHDSDPTFGFRFDGPDWSLGYASDVGTPTPTLTEEFRGVGVLAVEYNHDVNLQRASGRPAFLIDRVLGDHGHLSNVQAADLTRSVAAAGGLRCVVQLHLSRECNRPELAASAGQNAVPTARVVTATQNRPTPAIPLVGLPPFRRATQPTLPGLADAG